MGNDPISTQSQAAPSTSVGPESRILQQVGVTRQAEDNSFATLMVKGTGKTLGFLVSGANTVTSAMFANNGASGVLSQLGSGANQMATAGEVGRGQVRGLTTMSGNTSMLANDGLGSGMGTGLGSAGSSMVGNSAVPGAAGTNYVSTTPNVGSANSSMLGGSIGGGSAGASFGISGGGGGSFAGLGGGFASADTGGGIPAFGAGAFSLPGSSGGSTAIPGTSTSSSIGLGGTTGSSSGSSTSDMLTATQNMQAEQMGFNLQYLQLQDQIQQQNAQFSTASNVMKAKQDLVKELIQNLK